MKTLVFKGTGSYCRCKAGDKTYFSVCSLAYKANKCSENVQILQNQSIQATGQVFHSTECSLQSCGNTKSDLHTTTYVCEHTLHWLINMLSSVVNCPRVVM